MRTLFPGYFRPTQAEFDELWRTAIIVPDANILLHLLRYGRETREQVLQTLREFQTRIWIPHRVALEFLRSWRSVDAENRSAYEKLKGQIEAQGRTLSEVFSAFSRHQTIDSGAEREKIARFIADLCSSLKNSERDHPSLAEAEEIVDSIAELFSESIGPESTDEEMKQYIQKGKERYAASIPPGYMDAGRKEGDDKYGDYIIWEQIISISIKRKAGVIFVSDDRKEDWILRIKGQDIGPHPDLIQEFLKRTGNRFYSYSFRLFLEHAKSYSEVEVSPGAIAEIKEEEERRTLQEEQKKRDHQRALEEAIQSLDEEFRRISSRGSINRRGDIGSSIVNSYSFLGNSSSLKDLFITDIDSQGGNNSLNISHIKDDRLSRFAEALDIVEKEQINNDINYIKNRNIEDRIQNFLFRERLSHLKKAVAARLEENSDVTTQPVIPEGQASDEFHRDISNDDAPLDDSPDSRSERGDGDLP